MAKLNLTAGRIKDFVCPAGKTQDFLWDTETKGLGVRVTANGSKAYVFRYKRGQQSPRVKIGSVDTWTIPQAREEARRMQREVDLGKDPADMKAAEKERTVQKALLKAVEDQPARLAWNAYLEARKARWGATHYQDHIIAAQEGGSTPKIGKQLTSAQPLASLLCYPLAEITSAKVRAWLDVEGKQRPTSTSNAFRKFRTFIGWCTRQPEYQAVVHADCCIHQDVKESVPRSKARVGSNLQREQLADWFGAVRAIPNPVISAYLQALLLTGARKGEMLELRWENVCMHPASIVIKDKVDGERQIPLPPYLCDLIHSLPRRNEWVFFSDGAASGHLISPFKAHHTALVKVGLGHVSLHGLRKSFSTLSEWTGTPSGIVAQIMGHKPSAIQEKHYMNRPLDLLRMHHAKIESWILEQAGLGNGSLAA